MTETSEVASTNSDATVIIAEIVYVAPEPIIVRPSIEAWLANIKLQQITTAYKVREARKWVAWFQYYRMKTGRWPSLWTPWTQDSKS